MKILNLVFILMLLFFASCNQKKEVSKEQPLFDSLLAVDQAAYNSGEVKTIADLFTNDALLIANGQSTWSKDSIMMVSSAYAKKLRNFKTYLGPTTITENVIQMQKFFTSDLVIDSTIFKGKGIAFIVWQKQPDNSWKITTEIESYSVDYLHGVKE